MLLDKIMKGIDYKKFRESESEYFTTKDGRFTKAEVIKQMGEWLKQNKSAEPGDFLNAFIVNETK